MNLSETKYVFIHIPKCGGTSLTSLLRKLIPDCRLHPARFMSILDSPVRDMAKYNFFSGHFDYAVKHLIPGQIKSTFTTFRDPVKRFVSFYYFQRGHRPDIEPHRDLPLVQLANRLSLTDFLKCDAPAVIAAIDNPFTRTFLDRRHPSGEVTLLSQEEKTALISSDPESCIDIALNNIHDLDGWLFLEDAQAGLREFMASIGLEFVGALPVEQDLASLMTRNPGFQRIERIPPSDGELELIRNHTRLDLRLCELLRKEKEGGQIVHPASYVRLDTGALSEEA